LEINPLIDDSEESKRLKIQFIKDIRGFKLVDFEQLKARSRIYKIKRVFKQALATITVITESSL
jgi:hypothetical protein